jgi:hypothetical protein
MNSIRAIRIWAVLLVGLCAVIAGTRRVGSQCCAFPTSETSAARPNRRLATTITPFEMTISDSAGTIFDGRQIQEDYGSQGVNTCWYAGSPLPQHPQVTNPSSGFGPWVVGTIFLSQVQTEPGAQNHWGYDYIGISRAGIDQIRQDAPNHGVSLPCDFIQYQNMWIECDASTHVFYETDNALRTIVGEDLVTNCRKAQLDPDNWCDTVNY